MTEVKRTNKFFRLLELFLLAIFHFTRLLSCILPASLLYAMFNSMGYALFYSRPGMRQRLLDVISEALPEIADQRQMAQIGRQTCGAPFLPMLDLIILKKYGKRVMSGLSIEGMENLKKADAQGKGVIVITSHLGAFSIGASVMARLGKPITPIGFHPDTTTIPRYSWTLMLYAQSLGCDQENPIIFVGQDTIERVREHLRKGRRVGIAYDVMGNFVVDFLGRPTALASGVAYFACDIGSPVIPICLLRGRKPLEFRLIIGEPLCYRPSDDRSSKVNTITCEVAKAGEDLIREAPGQWMSWFGLSEWRDKARELEEQKA